MPDNVSKNESLAILLKSSVMTQEESVKILQERYKNTVFPNTPITQEQAQKILKDIYKENNAYKLPFGETVAEIMRLKGFTKKYRGKEILDVPRASKLTGLNPNIFRTNMYKSNCVVDMSLVVSICIGFKLNSESTNQLLKSAGLAFRSDNPEHIAYMFLLEYCKDLGIKQCNEILANLGIKKTRQLGSYSRGGNGEYTGYNV